MSETYTYDNLFAGHVQPVVSGSETITGGSFARGACLGRITASGKLTEVDSAVDPADGSQNIYAILAEAVDASVGDVVGVVYYTGEFNEAALTFGGTDDADTHRAAARALGIFFKTNVSA